MPTIPWPVVCRTLAAILDYRRQKAEAPTVRTGRERNARPHAAQVLHAQIQWLFAAATREGKGKECDVRLFGLLAALAQGFVECAGDLDDLLTEMAHPAAARVADAKASDVAAIVRLLIGGAT